MNQRTFFFLLLIALLFSMVAPAHADTLGIELQLKLPSGALLYTGNANLSDTTVEFKPCNQLSFDFTGAGGFTFRPLASTNFVAYDAFFTVTTPLVWFSGVSGLTPSSVQYSVAYDPLHKAIVFHHNKGYDTPATVLHFQYQTEDPPPPQQPAHVPEPSSLVLLGSGLLLTAGVLRRRMR